MRLERTAVEQVIDAEAFWTVFQPIFSLRTGRVVGLEALTRFASASVSPAAAFRDAHAAGRGVDLELATLRCALATAAQLPSDVALWVNVSPTAVIDPRVVELLARPRTTRLVVEVTEQSSLAGYTRLSGQLEWLRDLGLGVAIDDVGGGRTSYRHLRWLRPDHVKVDQSVTATLDAPRPQRSLARALARVARNRGATLVVEGVETPAQLAVWQRLGANLAQGFFLACPSGLEDALAATPIAGRDAVGVGG